MASITPSAPALKTPSLTRATVPPIAHVDNQQCLGCHEEQGRQWQQSHHAQAMAPPTPSRRCAATSTTPRSSIRASPSRFFKRDDKFFVRTDGPDGKLADFEVAYTFGVAPLQQYLIALPGGRLQPLQIAWDSERKRWFHLLPHEKAPPGDVLHWTGRYQTANTMCIACHTTGFEKRYDAGQRQLRLALEASRTCRASPATARASGTCSGRSRASEGQAVRRRWPASATAWP